MWDILFGIVFYVAAGLALVVGIFWYGRSLYEVLTGRGEVVIAAFDIAGSAGDADKSRGTALAHMLQPRLREIERELETAQQQLTESRLSPSQSPTSPNGRSSVEKPEQTFAGVVPPLYSAKAIGLETGLLEPANINVSVGGVAVGGIIEWLQRRLVNTRTLKFTLYEKKGLAEISGSLKPLGIADDALRLQFPLNDGTEKVDLDQVSDRLAHEIIRRRIARDPSNRMEVLDVEEFRTLVDILKNAARCNRSIGLGRPVPGKFQELLGKVEPLARAVPDWYQLNYLAASIAESAGSTERAVAFYERIAKVLTNDSRQKNLLTAVQAKLAQLKPYVLAIAQQRIRKDAEYAVDYFNQLLKMDLTIPPIVWREEDYSNAFWDGKAYNAPPQVQYMPDITYHEVSFQYIEKIVGDMLNTAEPEAAAILYSYSDIFGMMAKQHRLNQTAQSADWLVAEGGVAWVTGKDPTEDRTPIRSFKAPGTAYDDPVLGRDPQVAHMRDFKGPGTTGSIVHINSGIFNKAFYESAIRLDTERAGQIWIEALRNVGNANPLTASSFALLLETAAKSDQPKVREALNLVGLQTSPKPLSSAPQGLPTPAPTQTPTSSQTQASSLTSTPSPTPIISPTAEASVTLTPPAKQSPSPTASDSTSATQ